MFNIPNAADVSGYSMVDIHEAIRRAQEAVAYWCEATQLDFDPVEYAVYSMGTDTYVIQRRISGQMWLHDTTTRQCYQCF